MSAVTQASVNAALTVVDDTIQFKENTQSFTGGCTMKGGPASSAEIDNSTVVNNDNGTSKHQKSQLPYLNLARISLLVNSFTHVCFDPQSSSSSTMHNLELYLVSLHRLYIDYFLQSVVQLALVLV